MVIDICYEEGVEKVLIVYNGKCILVEDMVKVVDCILFMFRVICIKEIFILVIFDIDV